MTDNRMHKTLLKVRDTIALVEAELKRARARDSVFVRQLHLCRDELVRFADEIESGLVPPRERREASLGQMIVDQWSPTSPLAESIIGAERAYLRLRESGVEPRGQVLRCNIMRFASCITQAPLPITNMPTLHCKPAPAAPTTGPPDVKGMTHDLPLPNALVWLAERLVAGGFVRHRDETVNRIGDRMLVLRRDRVVVTKISDRGVWDLLVGTRGWRGGFEPFVWRLCLRGEEDPSTRPSLEEQARWLLANVGAVADAVASWRGRRRTKACLEQRSVSANKRILRPENVRAE